MNSKKIIQAKRLIERAAILLDEAMRESVREPKSVVQRPRSSARWVKVLRRRMGLTQPDFAARIGVSPITISRWENGVSEPLGMAISRMAELELEHEHTEQEGI